MVPLVGKPAFEATGAIVATASSYAAPAAATVFILCVFLFVSDSSAVVFFFSALCLTLPLFLFCGMISWGALSALPHAHRCTP
jgi:hypothetical protein